jgi:hypothetical protein
MSGNTDDQRTEDERSNDGLDQPQEDRAQHLQVASDL